MANYSAKILGNAISSLSAQQAVIATTSNNIANVNTPGYSRRIAELQTRRMTGNSVEANVGNGVTVADITRVADKYLEQLLQRTTGERASWNVQSQFLERAEELFALDGSRQTIGSTVNAFFTAANDLSQNPASIELRANFIERAQDLVSTISNTYNELANIQQQADQQVSLEVGAINGITAQIAELNNLVAARERAGVTATDERDQRDALVNQLSEKIGFSTVEASDGSISLFLSNGFPIVSGSTSRDLSVTTSPSFGAPPLPPSLWGGTLSYVVYDYEAGAGTDHVDLTQVIQGGDGSLGGILQIRGYNATTNTSPFQADGPLVEMASRVEAITRTLLTSVNQTYLGPDENGGVAGHQPSSGDLNGNVPSVYGLFDFTFGGVKDVDADGLPDDLAAVGLANYSSLLTLAFTDPRRVAAARDSDPAAGATNFAPGDGQNMVAISALQSSSFTFTAGTFSLTGTFDDAYNEAVTKMGNLAARAETNFNINDQRYLTVAGRRDEASGVSLDEEFANLIKFQKAYQAAARVIRIADELLEQLVSLI